MRKFSEKRDRTFSEREKVSAEMLEKAKTDGVVQKKPNGSWGIISIEAGEWWTPDYETEEKAQNALAAYHANKFESRHFSSGRYYYHLYAELDNGNDLELVISTSVSDTLKLKELIKSDKNHFINSNEDFTDLSINAISEEKANKLINDAGVQVETFSSDYAEYRKKLIKEHRNDKIWCVYCYRVMDSHSSYHYIYTVEPKNDQYRDEESWAYKSGLTYDEAKEVAKNKRTEEKGKRYKVDDRFSLKNFSGSFDRESMQFATDNEDYRVGDTITRNGEEYELKNLASRLDGRFVWNVEPCDKGFSEVDKSNQRECDWDDGIYQGEYDDFEFIRDDGQRLRFDSSEYGDSEFNAIVKVSQGIAYLMRKDDQTFSSLSDEIAYYRDPYADILHGELGIKGYEAEIVGSYDEDNDQIHICIKKAHSHGDESMERELITDPNEDHEKAVDEVIDWLHDAGLNQKRFSTRSFSYASFDTTVHQVTPGEAIGIEGIVGSVIFSVTYSHLFHLSTENYPAHIALNEYYDRMPQLVDDLAESFAEDNDNIIWINYLEPKSDSISYLEELLKLVQDASKFVEVSHYKSLIDNIITLISSTLYKLKRLSKGQKIFSSYGWAVDYKDEDGEDTAKFNSSIEANNWIKAQEAKRSSGEKFTLIRGPYAM